MHDTWSIKEVSKLVGISTRTIRKWCEHGYIRSQQIKAHWVIPLREVKRIMTVIMMIKHASSLSDKVYD